MTAAAPAATTPAPAPSKYTRITPKQWARIEALWEEGDATYADLVKQYGKSVSTFERHFKKNAIVKGSKRAAVKAKVAEELAKTQIDDATVLAARIKETKEEHYKMASALSKLAWNEILEAKRDARPMATAMNNLKALDNAMTVLKKAREERFAVLGLDRPDAISPDEIPELVISELTPEMVKQLRDRDHTEMDAHQGTKVDEGDLHAGGQGGDDDDDDGIVDEDGAT